MFAGALSVTRGFGQTEDVILLLSGIEAGFLRGCTFVCNCVLSANVSNYVVYRRSVACAWLFYVVSFQRRSRFPEFHHFRDEVGRGECCVVITQSVRRVNVGNAVPSLVGRSRRRVIRDVHAERVWHRKTRSLADDDDNHAHIHGMRNMIAQRDPRLVSFDSGGNGELWADAVKCVLQRLFRSLSVVGQRIGGKTIRHDYPHIPAGLASGQFLEIVIVGESPQVRASQILGSVPGA